VLGAPFPGRRYVIVTYGAIVGTDAGLPIYYAVKPGQPDTARPQSNQET
jgi:hypothetical protein